MVLLMNALETIGDRYGVYGFSGFGRENVEFYVIKEVEELFSDRVKRRMDKVAPLHATRMGPAIRHATTKLANVDAKTKFMFVISDGRPQDRGYSREGVEKEYAVQDTRMALMEARNLDITAGETSGGATPEGVSFVMKCRTSSGMSAVRDRSGGRWMTALLIR